MNLKKILAVLAVVLVLGFVVSLSGCSNPATAERPTPVTASEGAITAPAPHDTDAHLTSPAEETIPGSDSPTTELKSKDNDANHSDASHGGSITYSDGGSAEDTITGPDNSVTDDSGNYTLAKSPSEYESKRPDFDHPEIHDGVEYVEVLGLLLEKDALPDTPFPVEPIEAGVVVGNRIYPDDPVLADLEARAFTVEDTILSYCLWNGGVASLPSAFSSDDGEDCWVISCFFEQEIWIFSAYYGGGFHAYHPWSEEQQAKREFINGLFDLVGGGG